jgi:hypothetical protein
MKPSEQDFVDAIEALSSLAFFPGDAKLGVRLVLQSMVDTRQKLDWLVMTMLNKVGKWAGTLELRAVYCTRYKPADGVEASSGLAGFTAEDSEAANAAEHYEYKRLEPPKSPTHVSGLLSAGEVVNRPPPEQQRVSDVRATERLAGILGEERQYIAPPREIVENRTDRAAMEERFVAQLCKERPGLDDAEINRLMGRGKR